MKETSGKGNLVVESGSLERPAVLIAPGSWSDGDQTAALARLPEHLATAVRKRWKCYRRELKGCQKKFSEKGVHQFRVETRRLLSLIELLAPFLPVARVNKIRVCLKRHLDTFDNLRDAHVQLSLTRKWCNRFAEASALEEYLKKREKRVHRQTLKDVKRLKTKPLARLINACRKDLKDLMASARTPLLRYSGTATAGHSRSSSLATRFPPAAPGALLLGAVGSAFQHTSDLRARIDPAKTKTIHRTRVAFKRFRYMVETLSAFLPIASPGRLASMRRYQTLMGDVQDLEVLMQSFENFVRKKKLDAGKLALSKNGRTGEQQGKSFRDELLRRRQRLIGRYLTRAGQLDTFWPSLHQKQNGGGGNQRALNH